MPTPTPQLDAPGAGLPPIEAFLLRHILFPLGSRLLTPPKALATFQKEGQKILTLAAPLSPAQLTTPVLVKRRRGMEDSSRFWSVAMTIQHLILVGEGIRQTIERLAAGKTVNRVVSTADVKPSPHSGPEVLDPFRQLLATYRAILPDRPFPSTPTLTHPWFGDLAAAQWLSLAAIHQGLHRKQIESIIAGLTR